MKRVGALAALALTALSLTAASAAAAPGDVVWSKPTATWSGSLTFKRNGGNAVSCAVATNEIQNFPNGFSDNGYAGGKCGSQSFTWSPVGEAWFEEGEGFFLGIEDHNSRAGFWEVSPWSGLNWFPVYTQVPFTNVAGSTPSHLTFSETKMGTTSLGEAVTVTGTLNVKSGTQSVTLKVE